MYALQRHALPEDLAEDSFYADMHTADQLAQYAFRICRFGRLDGPRDLEPYLCSRPPYQKRAASLAPSPIPRHVSTTHHAPAIENWRGSSYPTQQSVASGINQTWPSVHQQTPEVMVHPLGYNAPFCGSGQRPRGYSQGSQRHKSPGSIRNAIRRDRSKSNVTHIQGTSSIPPVPTIPQNLPEQHGWDGDQDAEFEGTLTTEHGYLPGGSGTIPNPLLTTQQPNGYSPGEQDQRAPLIASPNPGVDVPFSGYHEQAPYPTADDNNNYDPFARYTRNDDWNNHGG